MGEATQGRTRGQYGRGLDLDRWAPQGFGTFVCPSSEQKAILLRNESVQVIDGQVVKTKFIWAKFLNHAWVAKTQEQADLMRKHPAYRRGTVKELEQARTDSEQDRRTALLAEVKKDPDLLKELAALVKGESDEPKATPKKTTKKPAAK
jgi:hypothetical protein